MKLSDRFRKVWNAFKAEDNDPLPDVQYARYYQYGSSTKPDIVRLKTSNERSIVNAVLTRIAVDAASIEIRHVRLDENDRFAEYIKDGLDLCLSLSANLDQTGRAFIEDAVLSMLDDGVIAIVPTDTSADPRITDSYDIYKMRVGKITEWFPDAVKISLYNERKGFREDVVLPKTMCAIVQNPFYSVMNERNSTMQRLIRKLNLLDTLDNRTGSDKLDMVIQLPYSIKTEQMRKRAEQRREDLEVQLAGSKYGIAYIDATEHITQLNRSVENQLLNQVEYLQKLMYSQLGMTDEIMAGTADEETMLNYFSRIIEPILSAIADELKRKFITKTARSQGQSVEIFQDPFRLTPVSKIADIADKFTRNAILSSNEMRGVIGYKPVDDPDADALRNKNLNQSKDEASGKTPTPDATNLKNTSKIQNEE